MKFAMRAATSCICPVESRIAILTCSSIVPWIAVALSTFITACISWPFNVTGAGCKVVDCWWWIVRDGKILFQNSWKFKKSGVLFALIAGIYPRASSKGGAHGSQSNYSTYPCAVVFTWPLTSRLCSQSQELLELPTSRLRIWSSSK